MIASTDCAGMFSRSASRIPTASYSRIRARKSEASTPRRFCEGEQRTLPAANEEPRQQRSCRERRNPFPAADDLVFALSRELNAQPPAIRKLLLYTPTSHYTLHTTPSRRLEEVFLPIHV